MKEISVRICINLQFSGRRMEVQRLTFEGKCIEGMQMVGNKRNNGIFILKLDV